MPLPVLDIATYDAYGQRINSTGTTQNSYRFAGEQFDSHVGQYYLRARYYDAGVGRFTGRDPFEGEMTVPLSLAKYPYVHGNPVNATDPSGMLVRGDVETAPSVQQELVKNQTPQYWEIFRKNKERLIVYSVLVVATLYTLDYLLNGSEQEDDSYGIPIVVWGKDLPETTAYTAEALSGRSTGFKNGMPGFGSPVLMRISFPMRKRRRGWKSIFSDWYDKEAQCKGKTGGITGKSCDEYPYNTTIPGGPVAYDLNLVSLKPVDSDEQNKQGGRLISFYTKAGVKPWHPQEGWFAVGTSERDKSYWIARGETEKNYFK